VVGQKERVVKLFDIIKKVRPYGTFRVWTAEGVGDALSGLVQFDLQVRGNIDLGLDISVTAVLFGFGLTLNIQGGDYVGQAEVAADIQTPAFGLSLAGGLSWPSRYLRELLPRTGAGGCV
jgi:hypothetical protein